MHVVWKTNLGISFEKCKCAYSERVSSADQMRHEFAYKRFQWNNEQNKELYTTKRVVAVAY